jgi:hypothetical protein
MRPHRKNNEVKIYTRKSIHNTKHDKLTIYDNPKGHRAKIYYKFNQNGHIYAEGDVEIKGVNYIIHDLSNLEDIKKLCLRNDLLNKLHAQLIEKRMSRLIVE